MTNWVWNGGSSGNFNTATNWTPNGIPDNTGSTTLTAGDTVTLQNSVHLGSLFINGSGTATLSGPFGLETNSGITLASGQTLAVPGVTVMDDNALTLTGSGNFGLSGGVLHFAAGFSVASGQNRR